MSVWVEISHRNCLTSYCSTFQGHRHNSFDEMHRAQESGHTVSREASKRKLDPILVFKKNPLSFIWSWEKHSNNTKYQTHLSYNRTTQEKVHKFYLGHTYQELFGSCHIIWIAPFKAAFNQCLHQPNMLRNHISQDDCRFKDLSVLLYNTNA